METVVSEMESPTSDGNFAPPKSLMQSVLEATAMRDNEQELRNVSDTMTSLKFWTLIVFLCYGIFQIVIAAGETHKGPENRLLLGIFSLTFESINHYVTSRNG